MRSSIERITEGPGGSLASVSFSIYRNQWSDVEGLRITGGLPDEAQAEVNIALKSEFEEGNGNWYVCTEDRKVTRLRAASASLLVVGTNEERYCGGSHGLLESLNLQFDRATGQRVEVSTWFDKEMPGASTQNSALGNIVEEQLSEECAYETLIGPSVGGTFWFSRKSMIWTVTTSVPPFLVCGGDYELPYDLVREFISEDRLVLFDKYVHDMQQGATVDPY